MVKRYEAILFTHEKYGPAMVPHSIGRFSTVATALRRARSVLKRHAVYETRGRRERFAPFVDIYDNKTKKTVATAEPDRVLVPSVGELGYW